MRHFVFKRNFSISIEMRRYKRYNKRRPSYRKKYYRKKPGYNWGSMARTALKTAQFVKSIVNAEAKYFDSSIDVELGTTAGFYLLNNPAQGTTALTRTGDSIKSKSITINYAVNKNLNASATNPCYCDVYLIYTKDSGAPTMSDLFATPTSPWLSLRKKDHMQDWKIIDARHFILSTVDNKTSLTGTIYRKLNFHTRFLTGTTDIDDGSLYLGIMASDNTYKCACGFKVRYCYYDN